MTEAAQHETGYRPHPDAHRTSRDARPRVSVVAKCLALYALLPGLVVFAVYFGLGKLIMGPLKEIPAEEEISKWFVGEREGELNGVTKLLTRANDTWETIGLAIIFGLIILAITRKWWLSILPLVAITIESSIFVPVTELVGRPRPEVAKLDEAPPTSSFPSGHTAAAFALYFVIFLLANRIRHSAVRVTLQVLCVLMPLLVAFGRLYRGMHHATDVLFGLILGVISAVLAYRAIRAAEERADR